MKFLLFLLLMSLMPQAQAQAQVQAQVQAKPHAEDQALLEQQGESKTAGDIFTWQALEGRFTQVLIDNTQGYRVETRGSFRILRPGHAEWLVDEPDEEAFYLSPEGLWHFDPWLEVATFHATEELDAASAIALLSGDIDALRRGYEINLSAGIIKLVSRDEQAQVAWMELSVDQNTIPTRMLIQTRLARSLEIQFSDASPAAINASDLAFVPPTGVEIQ